MRAGDLILALQRLAPARSDDPSSPRSGTMLHVAAEGAVAWAATDAGLALVPLSLEIADAAVGAAVVPNGFAAALREEFDRAETIELAGGDGEVLVRRPQGSRVLVQPLWAGTASADAYAAYNVLAAGAASAGAVTMRGEEFRAALRDRAHDERVGIRLRTGSVEIEAAGGRIALVDARSSVEGDVSCDGRALENAVSVVTDVKFPRVQLEFGSPGSVARLYGVSRAEPPAFGTVEFLLPTQAGFRLPAGTGKPAAPPAPARIEEPEPVEPLDVILAELDAIVGQAQLKREVRGLVHQVEINRLREAQGLKPSRVGSHLIFAGPPGTGKTTVARLVARLFHALGVLEAPVVHEVSRPDLVSSNVGGTEEKTSQAIADALGGVLFIDEAYTLADGGDTDFGKQAIAVLMKELEDRRTEFVCIIAGYGDRMSDFLRSNPGLESRFRPPVTFTPYATDELVRIAVHMAIGMDNEVTDDARARLSARLADEERRGGLERADWGNARAMRNVVEGAITHRDLRISMAGARDRASLVELTADDIEAACDDLAIGRISGVQETVEEVLAELDAQVGQPALKRQVRAILAQARVQQRKMEHGGANGAFPLEHLLFVGPPGTGKTTVARLIARLYRALGILPRGEIVEVDRQALVSGYVGQTATKTTAVIDDAMGGVLFIDEAYTLSQGGENDFGREAIATLLPRLDNDRGKFLAIAAGYPDDMDALLATNVGLASRFVTRIEFASYSAEELVRIAEGMAHALGEQLTPEARSVLLDRLTAAEAAGAFSSKDWGNARSVRNVLDRAVQQRDLRVSDEGGMDDALTAIDALFTIEAVDVRAACDIERIGARAVVETVDDVLAELDAQVGQPALKAKIRELLAQARFDLRRREAGVGAGPVPLEHLLFVGPPGTGKTTIARLLGRLYRALGLLPSGVLVEVARGDLVGAHIGSTAPKTTERIEAAMGGVLFIDEAYTLVGGGPQDFGKEAIETLMPRMENDRGSFLVIAAGYPADMDRFVASNSGLASRFTERIEFLPYTVDELTEIAVGMARRAGQEIGDDGRDALRERFAAAEASGAFTTEGWGNARQARIIVETAMKARDLRLDVGGDAAPDDLVLLRADDVHAAFDRHGIG